MKRKRSKRKAVREDRPMLLSPRESQVVELMGKGLSRAEISERLGVSRKCVTVFIERAQGKFCLKKGASTRIFSLSIGKFCGQVSRKPLARFMLSTARRMATNVRRCPAFILW
ncbi:MAG TPA: LuxR C-terminal-related transcriptional regulator, partial [Nitrososphaera sp.]|nr:LuxR C-terminal-related transcriptional regulator [Nitrososphaera sp.]